MGRGREIQNGEGFTQRTSHPPNGRYDANDQWRPLNQNAIHSLGGKERPALKIRRLIE